MRVFYVFDDSALSLTLPLLILPLNICISISPRIAQNLNITKNLVTKTPKL